MEPPVAWLEQAGRPELQLAPPVPLAVLPGLPGQKLASLPQLAAALLGAALPAAPLAVQLVVPLELSPGQPVGPPELDSG